MLDVGTEADTLDWLGGAGDAAKSAAFAIATWQCDDGTYDIGSWSNLGEKIELELDDGHGLRDAHPLVAHRVHGVGGDLGPAENVASVVVIVIDDRLDPRVVCVATVINVALQRIKEFDDAVRCRVMMQCDAV